jgi:hypothetical protein
MKRLIGLLVLSLAVSAQAQLTNMFASDQIIFYTVPHANLNGVYVRITPGGFLLTGAIFLNVTAYSTNNTPINHAIVEIDKARLKTWANQSATNKPLAMKTLAVYCAVQMGLTNNAAVPDPSEGQVEP